MLEQEEKFSLTTSWRSSLSIPISQCISPIHIARLLRQKTVSEDVRLCPHNHTGSETALVPRALRER